MSHWGKGQNTHVGPTPSDGRPSWMLRIAMLLFFLSSVPESELAVGALVIFMRAESFIQREGTFNALHKGAGQQMSFPLIHISCRNWNVSPVRHTRTTCSRLTSTGRELKKLIYVNWEPGTDTCPRAMSTIKVKEWVSHWSKNEIFFPTEMRWAGNWKPLIFILHIPFGLRGLTLVIFQLIVK